MNYVSEFKIACLSSVSPLSFVVVLGVWDGFVDVRSAHAHKLPTYPTNGVLVFFVWFQVWLNWLLVGGDFGRGLDPDMFGEQDLPNRQLRRLDLHMARRAARRTAPLVRNFGVFWVLCPSGISGAQFMEWLCRLSPLGRVSIYGFVDFGSVLQRRALLVCYDHGWWREPLGRFGRLYCGVWFVHLWPWWLGFIKPRYKIKQPYKKTPGIAAQGDKFACLFSGYATLLNWFIVFLWPPAFRARSPATISLKLSPMSEPTSC